MALQSWARADDDGQALPQIDVRFEECLQLLQAQILKSPLHMPFCSIFTRALTFSECVLQLASWVRRQLEPFIADASSSPWAFCLSPPSTPAAEEAEGVEGAQVSVLSELAELCLLYGRTAQMAAFLRKIDVAEVTASGRCVACVCVCVCVCVCIMCRCSLGRYPALGDNAGRWAWDS